MPKLLPARPEKVEKFLFSLGYYLLKKRGKGSHRIYKKDGRFRLIIIPFHCREVTIGTLKNDILEDLAFNENIPREQLEDMLNRF